MKSLPGAAGQSVFGPGVSHLAGYRDGVRGQGHWPAGAPDFCAFVLFLSGECDGLFAFDFNRFW